MSKTTSDSSNKIDTRRHAMMFAALGDDTRLKILVKLRSGVPQSIKQLSADLPVTRQAVTRHLRVLEEANFVSQEAHGRERRFVARSEAISEVHEFLDIVAGQWEDALMRLKSFSERK
ncbi:ArsR/SmtB family transcription factor [Rhodopirellula bahusiensis]|uniref:Transcriptional regulator n=1 Tax=Rhodopirellula bahusiensis TaxID=2014065 RepID=A0A2G1WDQ5_9BACT|nr:winged helix-turn-helix domain-containing protein [Rhodopirellula bahusiensis]PHQ37151.1 transcriptional regulator [Rhodopirellula bahusiensis]